MDKSNRPTLDFDVLEESWSDYELADGTLVRIKMVLTFIYPGGEEGDYGFSLNPIIVTWTPPKDRDINRAGSKLPVEELQEHVVEENVMNRCLNEGRSKYATPYGPLIIRAAARRFMRTDRYDPEGQPQYIITHTTDIQGPAKGADDLEAADIEM